MKTVNVATLKERLSEYLRFVENGNEVVVTSHRRSVARMVPVSEVGIVIRPPTQPLSTLRKMSGGRVGKPFSAVQTLIDDRTRR
ncbi:MAG: type II toxin-antitoxin system prevent-host-death family antitoxin [bacterium]